MGHQWASVFYVELTGTGIVAADLNTLATSIASQWNTDLAGQTPSTVVLTEVKIVYVPSVGNEITGSANVTHAGSLAGTQVNDASACFVINWNISAYYRGGHPRWYFPAPITADITNGSSIASARLGFIASDAASLLTGINALTTTNISAVTMGTLSFQTGNSWRATPLFRPFTGASVRPLIGSQRRRITS